MNKSILKLKLSALGLLLSVSLSAQQKLTKVSQSIKVDKDVTIDLNTSHCNIVFDTWNKGEVEIEAYIEGDNLSKAQLEDALKHWKVHVDGSQNHISLSTAGHAPVVWAYGKEGNNEDVVGVVLEELMYELSDLPEVIIEGFEIADIPEAPAVAEIPEMPEMPKMPKLPKLPKGVDKLKFDYEAYKKDGEKYMEKWSQDFESKFGEDYAKKMEAWGEKFGKEWGEKFGKRMEAWGKELEKKFESEAFQEKMEAWGERFGKQMEREAKIIEERAKRMEEQHEHHAERLKRTEEERKKMIEKLAVAKQRQAEERAKLADKRRVVIEKLADKKSSLKVKKTIKIKMPKGAKLKVNVRHGEIEFAANINNLEADLSHTKFTAHSVNGSSTSINASYSPVYVTHWDLGELNLKYVEDANLVNVKQLVLNSNSSNAKIQNLQGSAIIDGSIGDLKILKIDDGFNNLNVILQNSDAIIALPKTPYNLQYKGTHTRFNHPDKPASGNMSSFSTNNPNVNKNIVLNAKYSSIVVK